MTFTRGRKVHFVGIGGAGMSAIAKVLLERGLEVSGSDLKRSAALTMLEATGATVQIGHDASLVEHRDLVIVSSAITEANSELVRARELGIEVMTRGRALAELLEGGRAVVVAGTHGKTTTTSMIVSVLHHASVDPTYLIGGGLNDVGTNARSGRDDLAIAESDESDGSFLLLRPQVAVVTNVEADHLDYWRSEAAIRDAFEQFMGAVEGGEAEGTGGTIVVPADDEGLVTSAAKSEAKVIGFGHEGDVSAVNVVPGPRGSTFRLVAGAEHADVELSVPGEHNVSNALAAAAGCLAIGLDLTTVAGGLASYRGVERRFEIRGAVDGVTIIDDYAHHPTEVRATLAAARPGPWERIVAVFQPHRYSRTAAFSADFGRSFDNADRVVVTDVYGAGEQPVPGVTGKLIADATCVHLPGRPVAYLPHRGELLAYLQASVRSGDALITLGAGDVTAVGDELLARLGGRR
ncbi:MAG: UDP-N-acetylmuramate--L-alanine ligase [Actinomycetota bacterium]